MNDMPGGLAPARLARYRAFEVLAHRVVEGFMTGLHRSPFKGFAIEFDEHRPYSPGDDPKHVDWRLVGKLDRLYVKQYEEDSSLRACLALDCTGSMGYASGSVAKIEYGRYVCGVFAYLLNRQQDAVGFMSFDSGEQTFLPPAATRKHLMAILDRLKQCQAPVGTQGRAALGDVFEQLSHRLTRRALIVIVSDLFDDAEAIIRGLTHFSQRKHEVILFQILDRQEATFSFAGVTQFQSRETGEASLADPVRLRRSYIEQFEAHNSHLREACHRLHIDFVQMFTDEPFQRQMAQYLSARLRR